MRSRETRLCGHVRGRAAASVPAWPSLALPAPHGAYGRRMAGRVVGWLAFAVGAVLVALFFGVAFQATSCADAIPGGASVCTSGPAVGWPLVWVFVGIAVVSVALAAWQVVRELRRQQR